MCCEKGDVLDKEMFSTFLKAFFDGNQNPFEEINKDNFVHFGDFIKWHQEKKSLVFNNKLQRVKKKKTFFFCN